jgi:hypothetical protein
VPSLNEEVTDFDARLSKSVRSDPGRCGSSRILCFLRFLLFQNTNLEQKETKATKREKKLKKGGQTPKRPSTKKGMSTKKGTSSIFVGEVTPFFFVPMTQSSRLELRSLFSSIATGRTFDVVLRSPPVTLSPAFNESRSCLPREFFVSFVSFCSKTRPKNPHPLFASADRPSRNETAERAAGALVQLP